MKTKGRPRQDTGILHKKGDCSAVFNLSEKLKKAILLHRAGRLSEAEAAYKKILGMAPEHADTLNLSGLVAFQKGKYETAERFIQKAIRINPLNPFYHVNLGNALSEQDKTGEAVDSYRRALSLQPDNADALNNLGNALSALDKTDEAVSCYKRAVKINEKNPDVFNNLGSALRKLGRHKEASSFFKKALGLNPDHAQALNNLGILLKEENRPKEAIEYYLKALKIKPGIAETYSNLAIAFRADGNPDEAIAACRVALKIRPGDPTSSTILGNLLKEQGETDEAMSCYSAAITKNPGRPELYVHLGNILADTGHNQDAVSNYKKAIMLNPDYPEAYNNLGKALKQQGLTEEAIGCYRRALELKPDNKEALNNLGNALKSRGRLDKAVACYQDALTIDPEYAEAHNNLGNALSDLGMTDKALNCFQKALKLRPDNVKTYNNLGGALKKRGKLSEAVEAYEKALKMQPDFAKASNNLGGVFLKQGKVLQAMDHYRKALESRPEFAEARSNLLLAHNYLNRTDPEWLFSQHRRWDTMHSLKRGIGPSPPSMWGAPGRRLRIGYVSPDFRTHSVSYFLKGILEAHDRTGFKVFCYSDVTCPDEVTRAFSKRADCFHTIAGMDDLIVADQILRDKIDILVDLAGHTAGNRMPLFSMKPAPIQVTYLGYPNTTGLESMDYRLTDSRADPPGQIGDLYTEELVRLPHGFLCYTPPEESPEAQKALDRDTGKIVFGSFNNRTKITTEVVSLWAEILTRIPDARLILKSGAFSDPETQKVIEGQFSMKGIRTGRIELICPLPSTFDHLSLYKRVDIGLDTFPYNGTTTTCEALWMGVPVITLSGKTHRSRVGTSILSHVGLSECVAESTEEYVEKAVGLARNTKRLKELHNDLRSLMAGSLLMDAGQITGSLEKAYRGMFEKWVGDTNTATA